MDVVNPKTKEDSHTLLHKEKYLFPMKMAYRNSVILQRKTKSDMEGNLLRMGG